MPYKIRKAKCKQSDGTPGSYVLSYKDKSGKNHRACHTSKKKAKGQIAAIEMESVIRRTVSDIIKEELSSTKDDNSMKIKLSQLRKIIRETIEEVKLQSAPSKPDVEEDIDETDLAEDEFTYAIAKAAAKGEKSVDVDGEKFPVKMSKEKAKDIVSKQK